MRHTIVQLFTADEAARDEGFAALAGPVLVGARFPTYGLALASVNIYDEDPTLKVGTDGMRVALQRAQRLPECSCGGRIVWEPKRSREQCNVCGCTKDDDDD